MGEVAVTVAPTTIRGVRDERDDLSGLARRISAVKPVWFFLGVAMLVAATAWWVFGAQPTGVGWIFLTGGFGWMMFAIHAQRIRDDR